MSEVTTVMTFLFLASALIVLYWPLHRTVSKKDRYRLIRLGAIVVFAGTVMLTRQQPTALVFSLLSHL
jgi:hypothetical protein